MKRLGLQVFICSSPIETYQHCAVEKYDWVAEHLGREWITRLILTREKTIINADILIDDKPVIEGADVPRWEHILYDQPYNRGDVGKRRLTWTHWKPVILG